MSSDWPDDDPFDPEDDRLSDDHGALPSHWGQTPFYSLEAMRQQVSDLLDALLDDLDGGESVGARLLVDATLDCRIEFYALDGSVAVGADESLFVLARDRYGLADVAAVNALFGYLVEDAEDRLASVDRSQVETAFAGGERPLALIGGDGLPLDLDVLDRREAW